MPKAAKPVDLNTKHLTKKEKADRKEQEAKLKGNDNLVYKAPKGMKGESKQLYEFIVNELKNSNILNNLDTTILETCVDSIIKMKKSRDAVEQFGIVIPKEDGTLMKNPAISAYKDYNAIFNICMRELAMSPASRAKLSVLNLQKKEDEEDPLLKILRGNN